MSCFRSFTVDCFAPPHVGQESLGGPGGNDELGGVSSNAVRSSSVRHLQSPWHGVLICWWHRDAEKLNRVAIRILVKFSRVSAGAFGVAFSPLWSPPSKVRHRSDT